MDKNIKQVNLPGSCPFCGHSIEITRVNCKGCDCEINGSFNPGSFGLLPIEYQKFIAVFLKHRGNISQVEKELGISYPTINKMLETVNNMLEITTEKQPMLSRKQILDSIEKGEMSVKDAAFILKNR